MSQGSAVTHPTADEITTLVDASRAANMSLEDFGHDMRRLMNLSPLQKITKKFLREHMTMPEYELARKQYGEQLRVVLEEDVPNHEPPSETRETSASETVREAVAEGPEAVPQPGHSAEDSSSAPEHGPDDAAERDRQRLRAEVASWDLRVKSEEIEHVIQHNPYSKARQLLWAARRQPEPALAS